MPADEFRPEDAPKFRSPKRALALSFRLSRDRWKAKASRRLQEIKAFRVRVRDLQVSRDLWKEKAQHLERQLQDALGLAATVRQDDPAPDLLPTAPTPGAAPASAALGVPSDQPPPPGAPAVTEATDPKKKRPRARG